MAKIQFDIKYKPQIESGEYRVETQAGCPVRIVCWDMACEFPILGLVLLNDEKAEEMAVGFTNEGTNLLGEPLYDKLFIVTPEEELTEFEMAIHRRLNLMNGENLSATELLEETKGMAAELLALAREELFANDTVLKEYAQVSREQGKAEALKDLPRWEKWGNGACGNGIGFPLAIVKRGLNGYKLVDALGIQGEQYIMLSDLEKLPGFKED